MASSCPMRRIGKEYDKLRANLKKSHPLLQKVPLSTIDDMIAKSIYENGKIIPKNTVLIRKRNKFRR